MIQNLIMVTKSDQELIIGIVILRKHYYLRYRFSRVVKSTKLRHQSRIKKYLEVHPIFVCLGCWAIYLIYTERANAFNLTHYLNFGYFYIILQLFFTPPLFPVCVDASQAKQSFAVENLSSVVQGPCSLSRFMSKSCTFSVLLGPLSKSKFLNWELSSQEHP